MEIRMDQLERVHFLKHYLGGPALVSDENNISTGQIEQVELEDSSVLIKAGNESHWYDSKIVSPSLKKFKSLSREDIICIVDHLIFNGRKISESEILKIMCVHGTEWPDNGPTCWQHGAFVQLLNNDTMWITKNWSIIGMRGLHSTPDNIGTIIFLLCELGYDVTNTF